MRNYFILNLLLVFNINILAAELNSFNCPQTFPKAQMIAEEEMKKLLKDSEQDPNIKIKRTNLTTNSNWSIPDSSDEAIVVFAVVGVIVIIAWIPYALKYIYDFSSGDSDYCPWYRLSLRHKKIQSSSADLSVQRRAEFNGLQLGIASLKEEYSFLGLALEVGDHNISDKVGSNESQYRGTYFLVGPSIMLGKPHKSTYTIDLLGGNSTHENVSLIGEAAINWNINLASMPEKFAPIINLNFGANYLDIKENEGIVKNIEKYSIFWGFGFGVSF